LPIIFQTSKHSVKFSFLFSYSKHFMNPVFSFFSLSFFCKKVKPTSNDHVLPTTIIPATATSGSSTLKKKFC
jgi:hypothetical protein